MSAGIDSIRLPGRGISPLQQGFSILEVLLALAASTVLATGIGSLMVSGVRSQARVETYNRLQSSWYQAANVLEAEAGLAERIQSATTTATGCANLAPADVKLVLVGPANAWRTYYGVRSLTTAEATTWYGPNLLVRCGQPLTSDASGSPAIDTSGAVSEGVVADGLPVTTSFTATLASANSASGEISRAATVNLTLGAPGGGGTYGNSFALRLTYNAVYGFNNDIINGLVSCSTDPCQAPVLPLTGKSIVQWRTNGTSNTTITGTAGAENVVYINANQSGFTITGGCNSSSCILTKGAVTITMTNVNTLVFNDTTVGL